MKQLTPLLILLPLLLFSGSITFAQVDVTWEPTFSTPWLDDAGPKIINVNPSNTCNARIHSQNEMYDCQEGFMTASTLDFSSSNVEWVFGLDRDLVSPIDYAIHVVYDGFTYFITAGKGFEFVSCPTTLFPKTTNWTGGSSSTIAVTSLDEFKIQRTRIGNLKEFDIEFFHGSTSLHSISGDQESTLRVAAHIPYAGTSFEAFVSFDGQCSRGDADWTGASTGTMQPFTETDNVHIPASLGIGTLPGSSKLAVDGEITFQGLTKQNGLNRVLALNAANKLFYVDDLSQKDGDWQTTSGNDPTSLADDITKDGTVGIGTAFNQGRLHIDDRTCDNLPALRLSSDGVFGPCAGIQGELMFAESRDNFGVYQPRFVITEEGRVGIGTATPGVGFVLDVVGATRNTSGFWIASDRRYKQSIQAFENSLGLIQQLEPKRYEFDQETYPNMNFMEGQRYGFIAQELKEVMPELVFEDEKGFYSVNYIELIPVLTGAIQELKAELDELKKQPLQNKAEGSPGQVGQGLGGLSVPATLQQNSPNPFNEQTTIRYYLPSGSGQAELLIYDMSGKQLERHQLNEEGNGAITLSLSHLGAGMYLYTMLTNGQEVDTKRMILTD